MSWELPASVDIQRTTYAIRTDYRAILDICTALTDPELDNQERAIVALEIFYQDFDAMPPEHYEDAVQACCCFINGGTKDEPGQKLPRLVDWERDFPHIAAPVNRVLGQEIRSVEYLHWWTFLAAYYEIGDCLFAQIVRIRDRKAKGKPLDKTDQEFYRRNQRLVDLQAKYTAQEETVLDRWIKPAGGEKHD